MVSFTGAHRANDRELIEDFRGLRHVLGDLHARSSGIDGLELTAILRSGLQIPDIDRRWSTATPQQDTGFVVFASLDVFHSEMF